MDAVRPATERASERTVETGGHRPLPRSVTAGYAMLGALLAAYVMLTLVAHPQGHWWTFVNNWPLDRSYFPESL